MRPTADLNRYQDDPCFRISPINHVGRTNQTVNTMKNGFFVLERTICGARKSIARTADIRRTRLPFVPRAERSGNLLGSAVRLDRVGAAIAVK